MTFSPTATIAGLEACDVPALATAEIVDAAHRSRIVRGWLDAFDASLSARADQLHATGQGVPADELHTRSGGVSAAEGRRRQRRSKLLDKAPSLADALANGRVGAEHADVMASITAKIEPEIAESFFSHEAELAERAEGESPELFGRRCRNLLSRLEAQAGIERDQRQRGQTRLSRRVDATGMYHLCGVLHPELGAAIFTALDAEVAALVKAGGDRSADREYLAAEALGNLVGGGHQRVRPGVPEILVVIDHDTLHFGEHEHSVCELGDGTVVLPESVRRWCCQGVLIPVVFDSDSNKLDMGNEVRLANRAQRRALRAMYRTCAWAGCDVPFHRTEAHHVLPVELGGPTDLINLLPLCARHHHLAHEGGWTLRLAPDRVLSVYRPDGELHATAGIQIRPKPATGRRRPPDPPPPPTPPTQTETGADPALAS